MIKKLIIILIILALITLSGCGVIPEPPEPNKIEYRALLIGVSSSNLMSPTYNVDRMREIFTDCRFTEEEIEFAVINELKDLDATKEAILDGIISTFAGADDNDISYFYWMGHGGDGQSEIYICPADYDGKIESSITVNELEATLDSIPGTKVVFLETCFSGNFIDKDFNDKVIDIFRQSRGLNKGNYQVLTCGRSSQLCWENNFAIPPYGFFNLAFYIGCQDLKADTDENRIISLLEMRDYIQMWMDDYAPTCIYQEPQMYPNNSTFPIIEY